MVSHAGLGSSFNVVKMVNHRKLKSFLSKSLVFLSVIAIYIQIANNGHTRILNPLFDQLRQNVIDELIIEKQQNNELSPSVDILLKMMKNFQSVDNYSYGQTITNDYAEIERCQRFGLEFNPERKTRRRIFFGSLVADESWHSIVAHAVEAHGLYHSVSLVESNTTISTGNVQPRQRNFTPNSLNLRVLQSGIFGPRTKVTVDFYVDRPEVRTNLIWNGVELMQRELITDRWKANGMTADDIGIIGDVDETFSRDFLLAAQTCDIPEFRPNFDCHNPKISAKTLIFEASPECYWKNREWFHPDMMSGQCIDKIGDETLHKPAQREWNGIGNRMAGYGDRNINYENMPDVTMYPLWKPEEFRMFHEGDVDYSNSQGINGFHFHNFFSSMETMRHKYKTYGHPLGDDADKALFKIHPDTKLFARCVTGMMVDPNENGVSFDSIEGPTPVLYRISKEYRKARHDELSEMVKKDISVHGT